MSGDDIAGCTFLAVIVAIIVLCFHSIITDEYGVYEVSTCVKNTITYKCKIENGETLFYCDTKEECNTKCEEARNK